MSQDNTKTLLVTGATGFIGSYIVEEALSQGYEVWAAVRSTSSRQWLSDPRIHFINLNLSDRLQMAEAFRQVCQETGGVGFRYVVHAAGATKCANADDFHTINAVGTHNLALALIDSAMPLERFVFVSSLSVMGPIHEDYPYTDITDDDTPCPNTAYGRSKLEAEGYLESLAGQLPYIILRPTGVYGPRERDYFLMAKSIKGHTDFSVGYRPQDLTFIYVADMVQAVMLALTNGQTGHKYFLSDGHVYSSRTFSDLIHDELGRPWLLRIKAPLWVLRVVTTVGEYYGRLTGKVSALNADKYHIMRQRNWRCDISAAQRELGYTPRYGLAAGVKLSIKWYKDNGWL